MNQDTKTKMYMNLVYVFASTFCGMWFSIWQNSFESGIFMCVFLSLLFLLKKM